MYEKIDVAYYTNERGVFEYDFIVKPSGNISDIKFKYRGASDIVLANNKLTVTSPFGEIEEWMPEVYQVIEGEKIKVNAAYKMVNGEVSFNVPVYNRSYNLIIDPWITYYGGAEPDEPYSNACDANANVIVTGLTRSPNFPVTPGAYQTALNGTDADAFVLKFDKTGVRQWCTFYGGSFDDQGWGVTADAIGNIVITGNTASPDLPVTPGAFQTQLIAGTMAYAAKFTSAGALSWATYIGGTVGESGVDVDVDAANNVVVHGDANSPDFPVTTGCFQSQLSGIDIYLIKFSPAGAIQWATFFGGSGMDVAKDVATDNLNNIVIHGNTISTDMPVSTGAFQTANVGFMNGSSYVTKFDPSGALVFSTYFSGTQKQDEGFGIDADANGDIVVTGMTRSSDFPVTPGAFQTQYMSTWPEADAYISKFSPTGTLLWSTLYGGVDQDESFTIAVDSKNDIFVMGDTYASDFPTTNCSYQPVFGGDEDNYIIKFDPNGNRICAGFLGDNDHDEMESVGNLSVAGGFVYMAVIGPKSTPATPGAFQTSWALKSDIFLVQLCGNTCGLSLMSLSASASQTNFCAGQSTNFIGSNASCDTTEDTYQWTFAGATPSASTQKNPANVFYNTAGNYSVKLVVTTPCGTDSMILNNYITVNASPVMSVAGNTVVCTGDSTTLTAQGAASYFWSTGVATTTLTVSPTLITTYSVVGTLGSCYDTSFVTITPMVPPIAVITGDTSVCGGTTLMLTASGGAFYSWSTTSIHTATLQVTPTSNTTYTVVASNGNCYDTAYISITFTATPFAAISGNTNICSGNSTILTAIGGGNYQWSTGVNTNTINVIPGGSGLYTLTVSSGICWDSASVMINVVQQPTAAASNDTIICRGESVLLSASGGSSYFWNNASSTSSINISPLLSSVYSVTVSNNPCYDIEVISVTVNNNPTASITTGGGNMLTASGGVSYSWTPTTGLGCITCADPIADPHQSTGYCVAVTDTNNCVDTACVWIGVDMAGGEVFVPTAFSPNADGQNDYFYVNSNCVVNFKFTIFDRWGNKVFETTDPAFKWDGKYKGELMDAAVFVYQMNAYFLSKETLIQKGNISLVR